MGKHLEPSVRELLSVMIHRFTLLAEREAMHLKQKEQFYENIESILGISEQTLCVIKNENHANEECVINIPDRKRPSRATKRNIDGFWLRDAIISRSKGVLLTVTGLCLTVCWLCLNGYVVLKYITNATTPALSQYFDKRLTVKRMVQTMRDAAVDFFPDFDSHNHIERTAPKDWIIERHTYHAMAFLSRAYNFQWSRWNVQAGYRNVVMQFREAVDKKREGRFQLLRSNPMRTTILACNDLSNEYSDTPVEGLPFYPDIFTMNMSYGSVDARREAFCMKYKLVETVYDLLKELKVCSFA